MEAPAVDDDGEERLDDEGRDEDHEHSDHGHADGKHSDDDDHAHSSVRVAVSWLCAASPERNASTLRVNALWPEAALVDLTVITSQGHAAGRVALDAAFRF